MKTTALLVQKLRLSDMLRGIGPSDVSQKKKTWRSEEGPQRKPTHAGPPLARGIKYPSSSDFAKRESKRIYSYTNLECLTSTDPHILFLEASPRPSQWLPPPTPSPSMAKDGCARSRSLMMPGTSPNHSPTLGSTLGLKNSSKAIQLPWTLGGGVVGTYNPKKTSTNPTTWDLAETWWNEKKGHLSILMFFWLVVHWRIFNGIHMNLVGLFGIVLVWFWHTVAGRKSKRHPRHIEQAKSKNKHLV